MAARDNSAIGDYFEQTKRPVYSIVASAPFFIAYELGLLFLYPYQPQEGRVKNLAEVILHQVARLVGPHAAYLLPVLAGIAVLYLLHRRDQTERAAREGKGAAKRVGSRAFRPGYVLCMYAEGLVLALPLGLLAREVPNVVRLLNAAGSPAGQFWFRLTTMCGAGAYEELLFRLFLFTGFFFAGYKLLHLERLPAGVLAAVVSGVLFALFHFGPGRPFDLVFFLFAAIAGVYLAIICHFRSFGLAVAAHAIYDVFAVLVSH